MTDGRSLRSACSVSILDPKDSQRYDQKEANEAILRIRRVCQRIYSFMFWSGSEASTEKRSNTCRAWLDIHTTINEFWSLLCYKNLLNVFDVVHGVQIQGH